MDLMMRGLEAYHYQPIQIDDAFSEKVYSEYLNRLDYSKRFLLQEDVQKLQVYQDQVDDEIKEHTFELYEPKSFEELESVAREKVSETFERYF